MFSKGDKVILVYDVTTITHPEIFKKGETGILGSRYRVQDGIEIWQMILDRKPPIVIAVPHVSIEKI